MPAVTSHRPAPSRGRTVGRRAALALALAAAVGAGPARGDEVSMEQTTGTPATASARGSAEVATRLPAAVAGWTRKGSPRTIAPSAIFEYMDGAGELYLAYRLERLDVVEYGADDGGDILVELYATASSDDAFGLLSGDWGGEPVALTAGPPGMGSPWPRALYGSGLLRIWSDRLYARVFAVRESDAARAAVLALGRSIVAGRSDPPAPRLATELPGTAGGFDLRRDRVCFFRSHLVLNSNYFLGQQDLLDLGPEVEAVVAPYERAAATGRARVIAVAVRYPDAGRARRALARFRAAYLPEADADGESSTAHIEDGWAGCRLNGRVVVLVFEAPDRGAVGTLLSAIAPGVERAEGPHE